ncbi:auxin efflux carrier superfamily [Usnea florida]
MLQTTFAPAEGSTDPGLGHLILLIFEAVFRMACLCIPGYILARIGMFNAEMQKFVASLTLVLFTPCLIFDNLASQIKMNQLKDLSVILLIFLFQTFVSYLCSTATSKLCGLKKRPRNFVVAMAVFNNSTSVPLSLVVSLAQTLQGLRWKEVPGDNSQKVAARGILYLLIFQQLGLFLRWSWGYNVLLAPPHNFEEEGDYANSISEEGQGGYRDEPDQEQEQEQEQENSLTRWGRHDSQCSSLHRVRSGSRDGSMREAQQRYRRESHTESDLGWDPMIRPYHPSSVSGAGPMIVTRSCSTAEQHAAAPAAMTSWPVRIGGTMKRSVSRMFRRTRIVSNKTFGLLPDPVRRVLTAIITCTRDFLRGLGDFMNPPLVAILLAIVVALVPALHEVFFTEGTFINNSVTSAISQSGDVAIPLILVVLGANLAKNTIVEDPNDPSGHRAENRKILIASLVSRMVLPTIVMIPLLALVVKKLSISIMGDPVFIVVCFLLSGAPSALQLAQICQINGVYIGVMSELLFQSYIVWVFPSTLILVTCALKVVEWAAA